MSSSASSSKYSSPEPEAVKGKRKRKEVVQEEQAETSDSSDEEDEGSQEEAEPSVEDVPVLSHAERRRKNKEEKLAAKLKEQGSTLKRRKLQDGGTKVVDVSSTTTKRQNSVWVGNMSFKTQQENLKAFFKDVGEITRINMPTKAPTGPGVRPENRGFAYVDFATPEAKTAAIALSEQPLLGRKLLIKDGDDYAGRPAAIAGEHTINDPALAHKTHSKTAQKILRAQKQPPAPTLFLGNLGFETTDTSIRELFEAHRQGQKKSNDSTADAEEGEQKSKDVWIRKVRMGTFEDSGLCKGFAFVDFMTVEHATSALINPKNHHLNGRNLVVEYASADAVRRGAPKSKPADGTAPKGKRSPRAERSKRTVDKYNSKSKSAEHSHETQEVAESPHKDEEPLAESKPRTRRDGRERPSATSEGVRHKGPKSRPKPGAALALAKRESAAIIPSQGRKITF
ncbi:hypothetical protein GALMADRAFT_219961 [Galerina marginata CBS 339.88]|uniref:RRM domain-containing protein n=1 Tax=Galerina marginata (strain CBS 339.88) TaxID=685588 RepID=A0A067TLU4_GALM3|nr:hypothetical protein GALMADRAFT_219961 [Galerina marginata CBS 339.88]